MCVCVGVCVGVCVISGICVKVLYIFQYTYFAYVCVCVGVCIVCRCVSGEASS